MSIRRFIPVAFLAVIAITAISCIRPRTPSPPVAKVEPHFDTVHGIERVDDYYWLRERGAPDVMEYLEAENDYTEAIMEHTEGLQKKLYAEMISRLKETDLTVPEKDGKYYYYERTEEGKQYPIICRRKGNLDAPEEILIDENVLARGLDYLDIGSYRVSANGQILAYTVDTNGSELYTVYFKDLKSGQLLPDRIPVAYYQVEWANDNKTVYYTTLDDALRPYRMYRHKLATDYTTDEMLYEESDQAYEMYISKSTSEEYIFMSLESQVTTEVHYINADNPTRSLRVIHPRQHQMEYKVYHNDGTFYIITNDDAPNFKLVETPVRKPSKENWEEFIPYDDSVKIDGADIFDDFIALYERKDGLKQIRIVELKSGKTHYVEFPEPVYTYYPGKNRDFGSEKLRFTYSSPITPKTVYDWDMKNNRLEIRKEEQVLGGYDKSRFVTERAFATAADGERVPITLSYKKDLQKDGNNPALLYGYGSYGSSSDPRFRIESLSLLERGFVLATAHVRGGGEMGRHWYEDGKLLNKRNTFSDFIACAEYLIEQGYTSPNKLAGYGGSAGGLLIGAVANMRPDLFEVLIASVPFVDVVNTMLDPSIPLTVIEYEEWGNPNVKEYYDYMMSYSPYDNVSARDYPNMLITAGLNDARVQYWEPAKWTAKLRATKTDRNRLLLKTEMGAGHFGASGRYDEYRQKAFTYAFMLDAMGIKN